MPAALMRSESTFQLSPLIPPPKVVKLPLTVQLVSVAVPLLNRAPPLLAAEFPLTVQLVSVAVA